MKVTFNEEVFGIKQSDNQKKEQPVTFWFYSNEEGKIYRLAAQLQRNGYQIRSCDLSVSGEFLCIAEKIMIFRKERITQICKEMTGLAEVLGLDFDGWQTSMIV